ncbi:O-antigen ligase family protein, partial [Desulfonauticus submarinus]
IISFISSLYNNLATNTTFDILTAIFPYLFAKFLKYENINKYLFIFISILSSIIIYLSIKYGLDYVKIAILNFKNPTRSALFLSVTILLCSFFYFYYKGKKLTKYVFILLIIWLSLLLCCLKKVTPLVSLIICIFILLFKLSSKNYIKLAFFLLLSIGVLFTNHKLKTLSNHPLSHLTVNHRYNMWIAAINMFKEKPLLGQGYKSFKKKYPYYVDMKNKYYDPSMTKIGYQDAHNITLHLLAETGILGALLITLMFIYIFYIGIWKFSTNCMLFISSLCILLIYLNMQLHVHLDVNSVRALLFFFIGLFKNSLSHIQNDH